MDRVIHETQPSAIVFYGDSRDIPTAKYTIEWNFNQALKRIGIDRETRLLRHISFHSWRHTANTILRGRGVMDGKVRRVTGHSSQQMSER
jgi:integrase